MTYALIFIGLWMLLGALAPSFEGPHAQHNAARIIKPLGPLNPDGSTTDFAHLQEVGEYRLSKLLGLVFAAIALLVMTISGVSDPYGLAIVSGLGMMLVDSFSRKISFIDFAGHEAEILEAEARGVLGYREAEILRMSDDRDKRGKNIPAGLERARWLARFVRALGRIPNLKL